MKRLLPVFLLILAALAFAMLLYLGDYSLLPARQCTITLLYTGDVRGHASPCKG